MSIDGPVGGEDFEFDDELDGSEEQWLAEWDEADREAVEVLRGALPGHRRQPAPADPLAAAAATVRTRLRDGGHPLDWVAQAAGFHEEPVPDADAELLI
ncbi:MAG: hypothetical protein ACRDLV_16050, partial [Solirubrobacteraceae bacterium]